MGWIILCFLHFRQNLGSFVKKLCLPSWHPMELISKMDFAKQLDVMGAKFGTVLHVLASKGLIGMELCALCVLMGRSGTKEQGHVLVSAIMFGMEISVRKV